MKRPIEGFFGCPECDLFPTLCKKNRSIDNYGPKIPNYTKIVAFVYQNVLMREMILDSGRNMRKACSKIPYQKLFILYHFYKIKLKSSSKVFYRYVTHFF